MVFRINAVALCEEGVDRNTVKPIITTLVSVSPSAKRAWIEIAVPMRSSM